MNTYHRERVGQLPVQYVDTIDSIMAVITTLDDVKQVIMFGSCSRGANTENSDIDLLLLLDSEKSGMPFNRLEQKVGTAIYERFTFNGKKELDLLFADKKIYANSTDPKSVYRRVKKDGVILYEQLL
jgi:predicted nucleotidyltransferase